MTMKLLMCLIIWTLSSAQGQRIQHSAQLSPRSFGTNTSFSKFSLLRTQELDVEKLNRLISAIDKTWVLPRPGAREPVGSNFQYKKTCASIYKARFGACQQVGFGIMCFNYCFEQGERLQFRCQDMSDPAYCRSSSTFDTFLMKYRHDVYKSKSYIHQMISRCFATAICNQQHGILNTSIIDENIGYSEIDQTPSAAYTTRRNHRIPVKKNPVQNQRETSQDARQRWLKVRTTRPIWQWLLTTAEPVTTPKSFPIVAATEENQLAELVSTEENEENSENMGTTEDGNPGETDGEVNPESMEETTDQIEIEQITTTLAASTELNESRTRERPWWWYAALRNLENSTDRLSTEQ